LTSLIRVHGSKHLADTPGNAAIRKAFEEDDRAIVDRRQGA
jgi:hypothetical protein